MERIYRFKVQLKHLKPPVWRTLEVPEDYTFQQFGWALISVMGWHGDHLFQFDMRHPDSKSEVIIGEAYCDMPDQYNYKVVKICDFFKGDLSNSKATFLYDLGASWYHTVTLLEILPKEANLTYPRCISGRRACPPEDCPGEEEEEIAFEEWENKKFDKNVVQFKTFLN